ncbi:MAG: hypothetical protein D6790_18915, partial [Caldilineae bacterium]
MFHESASDTHSSISDRRYSWAAAPRRLTRRWGRWVLLVALLAVPLIYGGLRLAAWTAQLDYTCAEDAQGRRTCRVFYRPELPAGCP